MAQAVGGTFDLMVAYFPLAMGEAPLLWLDNLPAGCITSWAKLSQLFTSIYQATYNRPSNTHHLGRVVMRPQGDPLGVHRSVLRELQPVGWRQI